MLWSPSEVLAYLKDDASKKQDQKEKSTFPFGGTQMPSLNCQTDFILIAENSEIHGPNPIFTIPELDPDFDLNNLSTKILSADYQGLSNNKILPGKNAQLLIPDLSSELHVAVNYFFLFDCEARGFVRPTCLAYFTSDKHKLLIFAEKILNNLAEAAEILQHANILNNLNDLKSLRNSLLTSSSSESSSKESFAEARLRDVQEILDVAESYKGNDVIAKQLVCIAEFLKTSPVYYKLQNLSVALSLEAETINITAKKTCCKKYMKILYQICHDGLVLCLYHLYGIHKYFRRSTEVIVSSENDFNSKGQLYFGGCVKIDWSEDLSQKKCALRDFYLPTIPSLKSDCYFQSIDDTFQNVLLNYTKSEIRAINKNVLFSGESLNLIATNEFPFCPTDNIPVNPCSQCCASHIVHLGQLWDVIHFLQRHNPGLERSFLKVLRLFDDSQRLLFSLLTRTPIVVVSTAQESQLAQDFVKALSAFVPCKKGSNLLIDCNYKVPLKKELLPEIALLNFCLSNNTLEDFIPMELLPSLCVLNLKDNSLTAPPYSGILLKDVDARIRSVRLDDCIFPVFVSILSDIERSLDWWHMVTSSRTDIGTASQYVLSKGYNRQDIKIIETLSKLCKE